MRVLAVDVGTKNLAFCLMSSATTRPEFWEIFNCMPKKKSATIPEKRASVLSVMNESIRPIMDNIDLVVIEQQPTQNLTTFALQHSLHTWFEYATGVETRIMSASLKLADFGTFKTYNERKKQAIRITAQILTENNWDLDHFLKHEKKDDLADTFLMARYVHVHDGRTTAERKTRKRKEAAED